MVGVQVGEKNFGQVLIRDHQRRHISHRTGTEIEDQLFSLKPHRKFNQTKFDCEFEPGLPTIKVDVGQIQQVLLNLFNNAIEAADAEAGKKPELNIKVRHDKQHANVEIEITDFGPGMTAEVRDKIFEPHYSTKPGGHGLGLYNCKKIIENHGGRISVASTPGEKTTFTIRLPVTNKYSSFDS